MAKTHPAFRVAIGVSHHFQQTNFPAGYEPELRDGETVHELHSGVGIRKLVPHDEPYFVEFGPGAIDAIIADRAAAKALEAEHAKNGVSFSPIKSLSFNQLVARHIADASGMTDVHSTLDHWEWLEVHADPGFDESIKQLYGQSASLEKFLQMYFDLEGAPDGVDEEHKGDAS